MLRLFWSYMVLEKTTFIRSGKLEIVIEKFFIMTTNLDIV